MQERRKAVIDAPTEMEARIKLMDYSDYGDEQTSGECKGNFSDVTQRLIDHSIASEKRHAEVLDSHAELLERLSAFIVIQDTGEKGVSLIKWIAQTFAWVGKKLGEFYSVASKAIAGAALIFFMWAVATGKMNIHDLLKLIVKLGE